ncbi:flagellar biosynthetic protein FliR [Capillimicrobium parvum]|uniref:Flagellar biosynthetic protein FliR n=1 Tax=Capillimicrobium parvum TaxID=2884022 RepID=A0A9E6XTC3_9ACTN|nr:flagellar biosynthetic protein FliR [Capillimicrobium parvum]UGS33743.1 Flagellar biosynthetic protein FliR [Capillimicrobium parvum]
MPDVVLQQFGAQAITGFFLVLARVTPLFFFAPLFSSKLVPVRVRAIVAVALAIGLAPVVAGGEHLPADLWTIAGLILKELLVGMAFAFALGALFAALSVAGSFLDYLIGFSFGSLVDPVNGTQTTVLAQLYSLLGVVVFIAIDGDAWVLAGLAHTYDVVGVTQMPSLSALVGGAVQSFVTIFSSAVQVAGPIMLALVLTDAAFGLVSRVVPSLNVFGVGFPVKLLVGLILIGVTLPYVAGWLSGELQSSVSQALHTLKVG